MKNIFSKQAGFTMVELILVVAILGILAISALPRFLSLTENAEQASRDGVVGAIRAGLALYAANELVLTGQESYPASLDAVINGAACADCFSVILQNGVNDTNWTRITATAYSFNDGNAMTNYVYNVTNGTFQ